MIDKPMNQHELRSEIADIKAMLRLILGVVALESSYHPISRSLYFNQEMVDEIKNRLRRRDNE